MGEISRFRVTTWPGLVLPVPSIPLPEEVIVRREGDGEQWLQFTYQGLEAPSLGWQPSFKNAAPPADLYIRELATLDTSDAQAVADFCGQYGEITEWEAEEPLAQWALRENIASLTEIAALVHVLRDLTRIWRFYSGQIGLVELQAAWENSDKKPPFDDSDWELSRTFDFFTNKLTEGLRPFHAFAGITLGSDQPQHHLPNLFGALCLQLANHVVERSTYRTCRKCGSLFVRQRGRARFGQYRTEGELLYCSTQCASAATQQEQRRRQKEARRLAEEGRTVEEIAEAVGSRPDAVARWIDPKEAK